jgi:ABC-2 type transport system ATP-binding protein
VLVRDFDAADIAIVDLQLHRPSLDDVFLTLTGHQAEQESELKPASRWGRRSR